MFDETFNNKLLGLSNFERSHLAMVLLLDTSGSMKGDAIDELNRSLVTFQMALQKDRVVGGYADIAIVTFNSAVETPTQFVLAEDFEPPELKASGFTSMNEAIEVGLKMLVDRIDLYKSVGVTYFRPWLVLLTDGEATDSEREVAAKTSLRSAIENGKVVYVPMAIGNDANIEKLCDYYPVANKTKPVLRGSASDFQEIFCWLYRAGRAVVSSNPPVTDFVQVPPPCLVVNLS